MMFRSASRGELSRGQLGMVAPWRQVAKLADETVQTGGFELDEERCRLWFA
jgi:hypothetical protein